MKATVLLLALAISGCATCNEHPVGCAVGGALVFGAVAAATHHAHDSRSHDITIQPVNCTGGACK